MTATAATTAPEDGGRDRTDRRNARFRLQGRSILVRLVFAYLLPTLSLLAVFGWLAYHVAERSLEESLGRRLTGIAQAAAAQLRAESISFLAAGDDESRTARRLQLRLRQLCDRTGVARIFILDRELRSRLDTREAIRIGDRLYQAEADRSELDRVFAGEEASSVLFKGSDGRLYKTGYAPIAAAKGGVVVAAVGVEERAEFYAVLQRLRHTLLASGAVVAALIVAVSILVARRLTRPLRALAREARRIGAGDLEAPIFVGGRDEVGLLASTMNEMREALYQREREMQMMLSGIAHEVRNPLGGIELFSGILREELAGDSERLAHIGRIERELGYLKRVVNDFLDYSRRAPPALAPVDVGALAGEIVELSSREAAAAEVELRALADDGEVWALCDAEQIRRVLLNLTRNALQATGKGGAVRLRCRAGPRLALLEVEDSGGGVPAELRDRIFTPFFTTRQQGSGLGLALAQKIVDDHGGTIELQSEPGRGSTFVVSLPMASRPGQRVA